MSNEMLTIEEAAEVSGIPVNLIKRVVLEGLVFPVAKEEPYQFTEEEVKLWNNSDEAGKRIYGKKGVELYPVNEYQTKNKYILPFTNCWLVTDGGKIESGHRDEIGHCVRWAWDFCIIHPDDYKKCYTGMSWKDLCNLRYRYHQQENIPDINWQEISLEHKPEKWFTRNELVLAFNNGTLHKDHYCYEKEIIAPADGVIILPAFTSEEQFLGKVEKNIKNNSDETIQNIIIDHGNNEYSQIGHVLARSVKVRPGQKVKQGEFVGLCGQWQIWPHIHWAVWDYWHPLFAKGLPVTISKLWVYEDGKHRFCMQGRGKFVLKQNLMLERGMIVSNNKQ
ncbi:MAG: M23 family metallopeptidase [Elusimicrobiota bacterium]